MNRNLTVGIVGNGPKMLIPDLKAYKNEIDIWIGADRGALTLLEYSFEVDVAVGDFDSLSSEEFTSIEQKVKQVKAYPEEKNETDLELAVEKAYAFNPDKIYLFGVTGARKDHELINIQLLYTMICRGIQGVIVDDHNYMEMTLPGEHVIRQDPLYTKISFVPFSEVVEGLSLKGFYYPLENETIRWGKTRTISNHLSEKSGTYLYKQGIVLLIKSREDSLL